MVDDTSRSFNRFVRSLVHMVRGDLSVISNELAYLGDLVGTSNVALARKRGASIADVLAVVSSLSSCGKREQVSLYEVASLMGSHDNEVASRFLFVSCDRDGWVRCLAALREVLGGWSSSVDRRPDGDFSLTLTPDQQSRANIRCSSIGDLVAEWRLGDRAILTCSALDMFLRAQGWRVSCATSEGRASIEVTIPAVRISAASEEVKDAVYG